MMILVLLLIFVTLTLLVGGDRTAKALITLVLNSLILSMSIGAIYLGINTLLVTIVACILIILCSIFYQNEVNTKTKAAFVAVLAVTVIMLALIYILVYEGQLQGFSGTSQNHIQVANGYSEDIGINMAVVQIMVMLITLIGATIDTAIAIASGIYEVARHNLQFTVGELFWSGIRIGKDILSSTVNTLFFIFAGEYLILFVNFALYYSLAAMINSKEFAQGTIAIIISAMGCIMVIPAVSFTAARYYRKNGK